MVRNALLRLSQAMLMTDRLLADIQALREEFRAQRSADAQLAERLVRLESVVSALITAIGKQRDELTRLSRSMETRGHGLPSWPWAPETGDMVRAVLRLFRPHEVEGVTRVRLGQPYDGGYVMLDDFDGVPAAISCGINEDVSWDLDMAARGIEVHQFDDSIKAVPQPHKLFHFQKLRIDARDREGMVCLNTVLRARHAAGQDGIILKVDIEGSEWDAFSTVDPDLLATCRQVICEFHHLQRLADPAFNAAALSCLNRFIAAGLFVAHVHGNNHGDFINVGNVIFPDTLEVLFVNRRRYPTVSDALTLFPTRFDMPNQEGRADLFLGAFRF